MIFIHATSGIPIRNPNVRRVRIRPRSRWKFLSYLLHSFQFLCFVTNRTETKMPGQQSETPFLVRIANLRHISGDKDATRTLFLANSRFLSPVSLPYYNHGYVTLSDTQLRQDRNVKQLIMNYEYEYARRGSRNWEEHNAVNRKIVAEETSLILFERRFNMP